MQPFPLPASRSIVFRSDAIFMLLRKAFGDNDLGAVCKVVIHFVFCVLVALLSFMVSGSARLLAF